jgi:hypothetical protein
MTLFLNFSINLRWISIYCKILIIEKYLLSGTYYVLNIVPKKINRYYIGRFDWLIYLEFKKYQIRFFLKHNALYDLDYLFRKKINKLILKI